MNSKRSIGARPTVVAGLLAASVLLSSCAVIQQPSVPGVDVSDAVAYEVRLSDILKAARCEIAKGLQYISRRIDSGDTTASFRIFDGTMTFEGTTKTVETGSGTISALIPVGTSTLTPSAGYSGSSSGTQFVKRSYRINVPGDKGVLPTGDENYACKHNPDRIETDDFLYSAIKNQFDETMAAAETEGGFPTLQDISMVIEATFVITRKPEGGVKIGLIFMNPRLTNIGTELAGSFDESHTYKLSIDFPLKDDEPSGESRLVLECRSDQSRGLSMCIERSLKEGDISLYNAFPASGFNHALDQLRSILRGGEDEGQLSSDDESLSVPGGTLENSFSPAY